MDRRGPHLEDKASEHSLNLTVPKGARQMVVLIVPETNGAQGTLIDAVRGKPGEFVRASQDLNQASLDHARLIAFVSAINGDNATHPEDLQRQAPNLARSLGIKLNEDCLSKVVDQQASCLVDDRDTLVLSDIHTNSLTDTLTGAPTTLALSLSTTTRRRGLYSPYIGVVRDLAKVFGAFSNRSSTTCPRCGTAWRDRLAETQHRAFVQQAQVGDGHGHAGDRRRQPAATAQSHQGADLRAGQCPGAAGGRGAAGLCHGYAHDMAVKVTAPDGSTREFPLRPAPIRAAMPWWPTACRRAPRWPAHAWALGL
jgi:hypothetical protein